tara:strand:+ start:266 stop:496 length:231 start_codon:yes stop_codon:yes gene_type:complete
MKRLRDSIAVRAKFEQLQDALDDYFLRLKLDAQVKRLTKEVRRLEELHGITRIKQDDLVNNYASSGDNEVVLTRDG